MRIRMRKRVIALLPGDGIGPEVVGEARRVVEAVGERCGFGVIEDRKSVV